MKTLAPERIRLADHPVLNERCVQDQIENNPAILGLGEVDVRDRERRQPRAGRLDLLLQDPEDHRYELELQLGATDESHIIRTVEYWDTERKRYPRYEHTAVIVAEDITARFLNVIVLFNGTIPLIAIKLAAYKVDEEKVLLTFTTVLDEVELGLVDEDEPVYQAADRPYWENRGSKETVAMADRLLEILREKDPTLALKYNNAYVGLARDGRADNFVVFKPQKAFLRLEPAITQAEDLDAKLSEAGIDVIGRRGGRYRIRLVPGDIEKHSEAVRQILETAYRESMK